MASRRWQRLMMATLGLWMATEAGATEVCGYPLNQVSPATYQARIAAIACNENTLWFGPFIDSNGRLASTTVTEAEAMHLKDGATPAWRRVVDYWKGSGLLAQMAGFRGAADCSYAFDANFQSTSCRVFVVDNPWSAVFVSYVMNKASVPGFRSSPSHIDYVRDAYLHADTSPFQFTDPDIGTPHAGDLLCFARQSPLVFGHQGLRNFLDQHPGESLNMHCEIVVDANPAGGKLYLVGGNVLQGVTLRTLALNRNGQLWGLPRRIGVEVGCRPGNEAACNFSRQDWTVLLKLKPLPVPTAPLPTLTPTQPACCEACPLPMPASMRRCASPSRAIDVRRDETPPTP